MKIDRPILHLVGAVLLLAGCADEQPPTQPAPTPIGQVQWRLPQKRGVTSVPIEKSGPVEATMERLRSVVVRYARDPDNPWAVCHAILALGTDIELTNGEGAVDFLFATYGKVREVEGEKLVGFPQRAQRTTTNGNTIEVLVEAHPELILKALAERGVTPDRKVMVEGQEHTVGDLYRHCMWNSWSRGGLVSQQHWSNVSWGMRALATWAPAGLAWTARGGKEMTLDGYVHESVANLLASTEPQRREMTEGTVPPKDYKGLDAYTCGGAHSVVATGYTLARGFGVDGDRADFAQVLEMLFWYYPRRLKYLEDVLAERPNIRGLIRNQQLKFIGHFVELTHKLAAVEVLRPDAMQMVRMKTAVRDLVSLVDQLQDEGVFDNMEAIRKANEQAYLDFVGDSAHAYYGLQIATGDVKVPY